MTPRAIRTRTLCIAYLLITVASGCNRPEAPAPSSAAPRESPGGAGDAARGKDLITSQYGCTACHVIPGVPGGGILAPSLEGFASRPTIGGRLPMNAQTVEKFLLDPQGAIPGNQMPDMALPEQDARDITAYLMKLK